MKDIPKRLQNPKFRFIPLRERDKIPIEKNWQEKAQYKFDEPSILSHLQKGGNIGIVCYQGQPLVIDFDNEEIEKKISPLLPKTFTVRSGRGRLHKYFICQNSENMKILDKDKNTLCDIQADRKQVVIPPSIHPNGNEYYVIDDSEIASLSMNEIKAFFCDYISKDKIKTQTHSKDGANEIKQTITFEKLLRDFGIDISKNPTMCPLGHHSDSETCFHYDDSKQIAYCFHCEWGGDVISLIEEREHFDFKQTLKWFEEKYGIKTNPFSMFSQDENGEDKTNNKKLIWETAQQLLSQHKFLSYGEKERSTIYIYENGIFVPYGKQRIHSILSELLQEKATLHLKSEVIGHVYSLSIVDELPNAPVELLCLQNGILNVLNRDFIPHSNNTVFFQKIPINYEPTKSCPNIEIFLKDILKPEDIMTVKKWAGYCLLKDYRYHNLLMLNGGGANGKSTLLSLFKKFLGEENVCSIPMQQLEGDKFALVLLKNKLANVFADLPSSALHSTSKLKGLTGEDNFSADQKFKDHVGFQSYAKQMFSCNQLPILPEDNEAIWRRFILVDMPYTFDIKKRDVNLLSKLCNSGELSGFLNYALDGLKQLVVDNGFERAIEKTREQYMRKTDAIGSFVLDCLYKSQGSHITKEEIYNVYADYCNLQGYDIEVESVFFRHFKTKIPCYYGQITNDGKRVRAVCGVNLKQCLICTSNFVSCSGAIEKHNFLFITNSINGKEQNVVQPVYLQLENTFDRRFLDNILKIIDHLKYTSQHIPSFIDIQDYTGVEEKKLQNVLALLCKEQKIYNPKPDCYELI